MNKKEIAIREKLFNNLLSDLLDDDDFKNTFIKYKNTKNMKKYKDSLITTLSYCLFDGYFNPFLDKKYIDVSYYGYIIGGSEYIINIDDVYDCFKSDLAE